MSGGGALGERLRAVEVPEEDAARERAARVVAAAFAAERGARAVVRRPRARRLVPALVAAATTLTALLAFTTPGEAVRHWVRDVVAPPPDPARTTQPALERLPAAGSLLVRSPAGVWVVRRDGSKRLLGPYSDATWSPRARFLAAVRGTGLLAVEPEGRAHWTLARPGARRPRWAPSGFRVAYVQGGRVRVVAGDGTDDRDLGRGVAAEWRPGGPHHLAIARRDGLVVVRDADGLAEPWRTRAGVRPSGISWSPDGKVLLVTGGGRARVLRFGRPAAAAVSLGRAQEAVFSPRRRRIALIRRRGGVSELVLGRRLLFAGAGELRGLTWSPDGRWLAVAWPTADEFLFVRTTGKPQVRAIAGVAQEFDPRFARGAPTPAGWR